MEKITVPFITGDGVGAEITPSMQAVVNAALKKAYGDSRSIEWKEVLAGERAFNEAGSWLPEETMEAFRTYKVGIKGPLTTPIGGGIRSLNVALRQTLDLYVCLRPVRWYKGVVSPVKEPQKVNMCVFRENTEDIYAGLEHKIDDNTAECIKIISKKASERICRYAFDYAVKHKRKEVCCVTKANICKLTDGLFLECFRNVGLEYPKIKQREILVDNLCMQLVQDPTAFDVLVMPNLYGDIVSDLTAGLIGGLGVAQGANIGKYGAVFEPVHGSAPDIKGKNKANPTALLLSAIDMLRYIEEDAYADKIEKALYKTLEDGCFTEDLGGKMKTTEFRDAVIMNLQ